MKERSTIDIVVILLTAVVGLVLVLTVLGVLIVKVFRPEIDTSRAGEVIANITTTIVGALVGFIGGRATGRLEEARANGTTNKSETKT